MSIAATKQIMMSDMFVNNTSVGNRHLKTTTQDFKEIEISRGYFFTGTTKRDAVTPDDTYYSVVVTGAKWLVIEDLDVFLGFEIGADGEYLLEMHGFIDISNANTWSYAQGTEYPMGTPLNALNVNDKSISKIDLGVSTTLTGVADYHLFDEIVAIDSSGNRENMGVVKANMLANGRVLILPPNSKALVETKITGPSTHNVSITTNFYFKELDVNQFPQAEDI